MYQIHLWVTSWESFDKIHHVVMLNYCIISIWSELSILQIDLVCHIRLGISFLKVSVGIFRWLTLPFYAVLEEYLTIQTSQRCWYLHLLPKTFIRVISKIFPSLIGSTTFVRLPGFVRLQVLTFSTLLVMESKPSLLLSGCFSFIKSQSPDFFSSLYWKV